MFKHFHGHFPMPAWAGFSYASSGCGNYLFQHRKHFIEELFNQGWGEEQRTRRGDIKFLLLELLAEQPSHGYDLIKKIENQYSGLRRLSPGSVYPTLQLLEDGGYVISEQGNGKRIYTITEEGRQLLAERVQQGSSESTSDTTRNTGTNKSQEFWEFRQVIAELANVVIQVARSGNSERMRRVRELLEQVKRDIYAILAER